MAKDKYLCGICYTNIGMHKCSICQESICEKCICIDDTENQICCKCNELPQHKIIKQKQ